ncbi:MAG: copper resistance protein CopC, partial [Nocardioidaceae bacterium]|nr:copper resistance protein CopC [Nocardioidaceae bacterium]
MRRLSLLLALVAVLVGLAAAPASAHTDLVTQEPAPGAALDRAPTTVTLTFDTTVVPELAQVVVEDGDGADHVSGRPAVLGGRVQVPVSGVDRAGSYRVGYRVVGADGHAVTGDYELVVDRDLAGTAEPAAPAPAVEPATMLGGPRVWLLPSLALLALAVAVVALV